MLPLSSPLINGRKRAIFDDYLTQFTIYLNYYIMSCKHVVNKTKVEIIFNNLVEDQFVKTSKHIKGTQVGFSIEVNSERLLNDIFRRYTNNSFEFKKTEVKVKLYQCRLRFRMKMPGMTLFL
jgi:hypothetical protein